MWLLRTPGMAVLCLGIAGIGGVRAGGKTPDPGHDLARYDAKIKPTDRLHWSFQPVKKPAIPGVRNGAWVRNPIDAFILEKLEEKVWQPSPAAPPRVLLRRLHLDLTGLPPTLAEQSAFLKNPTPEALDEAAKDLLARPSHGERWARHWLDVVRYAESAGYERDAAKPNVWRYRDYVIQAFNDDKPFDRFILEQLAGDELPEVTAETLVATGFHRLGPWDDEPADPKEDRFDQLDDMINTTSLAFLGLSLGCARCHDHKFEPLTMHDYYRMAAIFNPLQRPAAGRTELDLPIGTPAQLASLRQRDEKIGALLQNAPKDGPKKAEIEQKIKALQQATPDLPRGYFMHEPSFVPPPTHLLIRGKAARPGPEVQPGLPTVLVDKQPNFPPLGQHTSKRRLTLARWIASKDNPLTARVIVNRVWHYHFGEGLVRSPNDFGVMGQPPTHPELLDWLAAKFVEDGWSIKKLHQLIVTSNTYRMSKKSIPDYAAKDPENELLWRFPYKRLEIEAIRDSVLAVSGQLNSKMYGPSMFPPIPKDVLAANSDLDKIWHASDEREASRRTIYAFTKRALMVPMLEVLDFCDTTRSADKRLTTTVAPQALNLFNGDFINGQARHFAERLMKEVGLDPTRQMDRAYHLALGRPPTETELAALVRFMDRQAVQAKGATEPEARRLALTQACRVIFNLNEFVYGD